MNFEELAQKAIEILKSGGAAVFTAGCSKLWEWVQEKVTTTIGIAAINEVKNGREIEDNWEILEIEIKKAMKANGALADELKKLISELPNNNIITLTTTQNGTGHASVTVVGDGNQSNVSN